MKMKTILHEDVSGFSIHEPKAMFEVVGQLLVDGLKERYPATEGYLVERNISSGSEPSITTRWDISLSRGKLWKFKLVLEVLRTMEKTFFHVSLGPDIHRNSLCFMLGMALSLIGLLVAFGRTGQAFNGDLIVPVLIGSVISGFILSFPIRWLVHPYIMAKARQQGIEESEQRLIEEVKEVLGHAGQMV
jgi:hypothetical protein